VAIFRRLLRSTPVAADPLLEQLASMPVPLADAGSFVAGFERDETQSQVSPASPAERKAGAVAQLTVQWNIPAAALDAHFEVENATPFLQWVRQLVLILTDAEAAARWFAEGSSRFRKYEGREVSGFRYGKILVSPLADVADQAEVLTGANERRGTRFVDTYVIVRSGRIFGTVSASTFGELDVRNELEDLSRKLVARIRTAADSVRVAR